MDRGERLTINDSVTHVKFGGDVMCDNQQSALMAASEFPGFYLDKIHGSGQPVFYPHYHPWNGYGYKHSHPHIWFYFSN